MLFIKVSFFKKYVTCIIHGFLNILTSISDVLVICFGSIFVCYGVMELKLPLDSTPQEDQPTWHFSCCVLLCRNFGIRFRFPDCFRFLLA